jgi:hypothetical protein
MHDKQRVTVNLAPEIVAVLRDLAKENGTTMTEEIRRAISDRKFFADEQAHGKKIILEGGDDERTLVEFR